ncbi:hypothetical protein Tdes44962_MAKER08804 [Teratosphaeria destructans]|uniref:Uncharacterized protein n=1 Tax=Teratosphaeria destructans TaxID=418781 RepID=A0A9W7W3R6_9PEZI|nr:hypothetical protein Tdes44962_MAKER08804 [Teratosphaeria destructans]
MARMKRASMPEEAATAEMAERRCEVSSSELLGAENWVQDCAMTAVLAVQRSSKEAQEDCAGQPAEVLPSPVYIL